MSEAQEVEYGRIPDGDEHKRQLQRIVANHPMKPEIREGNQ